MRPKLALKNIIRSAARSVFIFILLASTTCLLFSNVMEYYINRRETLNAIEAFDGIGTMEEGDLSIYAEDMSYGEYIFTDPRVPMDFYPAKETRMYKSKYPYDKLYNYQTERIEALDYITYVDKRYITSGVSEEYKRLDMEQPYYYDFTNCFVVEATVDQWYDFQGKLLVSDFKFIGGEELVNFDYDKLWIAPQPTFDVDEPYLTVQNSCIITDKSIYTADYCSKLEAGKRYVFIGRMTPVMGNPEYQTLQLTDHFTYGWCDGVWALDGEPENYLETEKFAPLRQYINLIETDLYTFDVVYTQNMGAIRYFADGTLAITDGRRLTREDYLNNSNVCVINHEVARVYGLEVGDTITLDLGNKLFEQYEGIGAIAAVPQRLATEYTNVTLEIVGIWKDTRHRIDKANHPDPCWSYNINTVFVPTHLLNADEAELENHKFAMGEYSFVIENVYDVELFDGYEIYRLDLRLTLDDGNWKDIEQHFEDSKTMSLIKIAILSAAVFVAVWFTVLLYILGRKRDYAIMRLLGTTKKASRNTLLLPFSVITSSAVIIGTLFAWIYTLNNAEVEFNISQMAEYQATTSVPVWLIISCIIVVLLLALGIAYMILGFIGRRSPLALMQDSSQKRRKKRKDAEPVAEPETITLGQWVSLPRVQHDGKKRTLRFIFRFVFRNIKRAKSKAIMYILVSALLLNAAGQLNILLDTYIDTFTSTKVVSKYAGSLNLNYVLQLQESGYVKDVFYRAKRSIDINMVQTSVHVTNNISRLLGKTPNITWLDGYDESVMNTHDNVIILDKLLMEKYGYNLGDTVYITNGGQFKDKLKNSIFNYHNTNGYALSDDEVTELLYDDVVDWYMNRAGEFIIVGCIDTGPMPEFTEETPLTEEDAKFAYMPGTMDFNTAYGKLVIMEMTEATLLDNWQADEYREYGRMLADANLTFEVAFIMDTAVVDYLEGVILLLQLVAPIAIIAMLIIGAFMTCLIIIQTSKDIAIMRVLGTSKRRTRAIIVTERIILYLVSVVLSVIVMLSMRGVSEHTLYNMTLVIVLYFAAVVISSAAAAVAVTRKKVLELLQTKE